MIDLHVFRIGWVAYYVRDGQQGEMNSLFHPRVPILDFYYGVPYVSLSVSFKTRRVVGRPILAKMVAFRTQVGTVPIRLFGWFR